MKLLFSFSSLPLFNATRHCIQSLKTDSKINCILAAPCMILKPVRNPVEPVPQGHEILLEFKTGEVSVNCCFISFYVVYQTQ